MKKRQPHIVVVGRNRYGKDAGIELPSTKTASSVKKPAVSDAERGEREERARNARILRRLQKFWSELA
jgi:hypothetical protein